MFFIVFDLELNQDFSSLQSVNTGSVPPFEIIQIGAFKLDSEFNTVETFNRYVKPSVYKNINPFVTELTGITTEQLQAEKEFPDVFRAFTEFAAGTDSIFCTWGTADMKELFRNAENHKLSSKVIPNSYINVQPYVSRHFNFSPKNLLRLQHAAEALNIPLTYAFHDALYDAFYTAEIFKKIYNPFIQPDIYVPNRIFTRPRRPKRVIDVEGLMHQFEKMYAREMTEEEQSIILLAYKMGKTSQFLR